MISAELKKLRREISEVFKITGCLDLYGSDDSQRLNVIKQVLIAEKRYNEKVKDILKRIESEY